MKLFLIAVTASLVLVFMVAGIFTNANAQCAMCQASVTSSDTPEDMTRGLNTGILYLLAIPYMLFAGFAITIYRSIRKKNEYNFEKYMAS
jgi:hypothetical protein